MRANTTLRDSIAALVNDMAPAPANGTPPPRAASTKSRAYPKSWKSKYHGVSRGTSPTRPWQARIVVAGKAETIGTFPTEEEAALAYDRRAREIGRTLWINFPDPPAPPPAPSLKAELDAIATISSVLDALGDREKVREVLAFVVRHYPG